MLKKDWIDCADDYICLLSGSGTEYEVIVVREADDNEFKRWFHGVLFLDDYSEKELWEILSKFGFEKTDVDSDAFFYTVAICLADLQEMRIVPEQWVYERIKTLTGLDYQK